MRQPVVIEDLAAPKGLGLLVVGPERGDAAFFANWLLAALKAEVLWKEALNEPGFAKQVDALMTVIVPNFGMAACGFLMRLGDNQISFVIDFDEGYSVEEFVVMAKMGFFEYRGTGYHFDIPADLDSSRVKAAALRFAQTEDEDYSLHPEYVVSWMRLPDALQCQWRHLALYDFERQTSAQGKRSDPNPVLLPATKGSHLF